MVDRRTNYQLPKSASQNAANLLLLGIIPALVAYSYWLSDTTFTDAKAIGAGTMFVAAIPLYRHLFNGVRRFPLYALNTLYYAFGFAIGPFLSPSAEKYRPDYTTSNMLECSLLCLVGVVAQILGYELSKSNRAVHIRGSSIARLSDLQLRFCGWALLILGQVPLLIPVISSLPSVGQFLRLASFAGFSVGLYNALASTTPRAERYLFLVVCFPFIVWTGLTSGLMAEGLRYLLLATLIALASAKIRTAAAFASLGLVVYFITSPIKVEFRKITWQEGVNYSWLERSELLINLIGQDASQSLVSSEREMGTDAFRTRNLAIDRVNQMYLLLRVVSYTPRIVPYWKGQTLASLPAIIIPRALWPSKPARGLGQLFGHTYHILGTFDRTTAINTPWLVELYANAGWIGVIGGMLAFGALFHAIEKRFLDLAVGGRSSILMIGLFGPLIYPESDISMMWGGVLLGYIALYVVCNVVSHALPNSSPRARLGY